MKFTELIHAFDNSLININMRCIEIWEMDTVQGQKKKININMRCIEIDRE